MVEDAALSNRQILFWTLLGSSIPLTVYALYECIFEEEEGPARGPMKIKGEDNWVLKKLIDYKQNKI